MEQVAGAMALWLVWSVLEHWLEASTWLWYLLLAVAGVGYQLLICPGQWYLGFGIGGLAAFIMLLANLLLVTADAATVEVLRRSRR